MPRVSVRGQLVEAALAEFHGRGYNACGVKDITDAAGVPKGSFYNHFASKEALAEEALIQYAKSRRLDMLADTRVAPLTRLRDHFLFLAGKFEANGFTRGCLLGNFANEVSDHSPALAALVQDRFDRWSAAIAGVLREAQAEGTVPPGVDAERMGRFMVNAWQGTTMRAKVTKSRSPIDDFFAVTFDALLAVGV